MVTKHKIIEKLGVRILKKSALNIRNADEIIHDLLNGKGYKTILEIGTFRGITSAYMSQYCDKLITIDLVNGKNEFEETAVDREDIWRELGIDNIELKLFKNDIEKAEYVNSINFDFAFIDGGHNYHDVELDYNLCRKCGKILFHDYDDRGIKAKNQVKEFIDTLPKEQVSVRDIFAYWEG